MSEIRGADYICDSKYISNETREKTDGEKATVRTSEREEK